MIRTKPTYLLLIFAVFSVLSLQVKSQEDLRDDKTFFEQQINDFEEWLIFTNLNQVIRVDSFRVQHDKIKLYMGSPFNDTQTNQHSDSLATAWADLKNNFVGRYNIKLEEKLLNTFSFMVSVKRDVAEIILKGKNPYLFTVRIYSVDNRIQMEEKIAMLRKNGTIIIPPYRINPSIRVTNDTFGNQTVENVRQSISDSLLPYYRDKGVLWYTADVNLLSDYEDELIFEVTDLNREILHDIGYFEFIRITIKVEQRGDNIAVIYDIQGKYGSGIFVAPRRGNYKNMHTKYPEYMDNYEIKIRNMIRKTLE